MKQNLNLNPIFTGCCDNVNLFSSECKFHWHSKFKRCNNGLKRLPVWKKLVQIALGYHRATANPKAPQQHEVTGWKLEILKMIIKPAKNEAVWRWIRTNRKLAPVTA